MQMRRVLCTGLAWETAAFWPCSHYFFSVWDAHRYNPFARLAHEVIGSFFPRDPPQFYQIPYGYSAIDPIKESLIAAEFSDFKAVVVSEDRMISDVAAFARGMIFGNPVIEQIKTRGGIDPEAVTEALARAFRRELGPEPCRTRMQVVMFEAARRD